MSEICRFCEEKEKFYLILHLGKIYNVDFIKFLILSARISVFNVTELKIMKVTFGKLHDFDAITFIRIELHTSNKCI